MKTLNRTLSLTLVFALVFSLMSFAFAADTTTTATTGYTDAASITYNEAVDVVTAIGVFQGNDSNAFAPKDNLTREQAAKVITYLTMGKAAADKLTTSSAPFTDVPADRWSAGSIAYCKQQGIIAGYGDGNFGPTDTVTGYQFDKMLLVALGYDASIEQFNGNDWSINVAKRAFQNKLSEGNNAFVGSNAANREEAALYTKNTLLAGIVTYETKGTNITMSDGSTVVVGASAPKQERGSFMANYYSTLKVNSGTDRTYLGKGTDDFGRASNNWAFKGVAIGKYATEASITYTADMQSVSGKAQVTKDLKGFSIKSGAEITVNGYDNNVAVNTSTFATQIAGYTGNGTLVEVAVDNDNAQLITGVTVVKTDLAKVSAVSSKSVTLTTKSATPVMATYTIKSTDDLFDSVKALAVGDYVLVTPIWTSGSNYAADTIAIPTQVTGIITNTATNPNTGASGLKSITINSKAYAESAAKTSTIASAAPDAKLSATLWLDSYGYAVNAKTATVSSKDFLYVTKAYSTVTNGEIVYMAKGYLTDGTAVDVETNSLAAAGSLYVVTGTPDDVYTLGTAYACDANAVAVPGSGNEQEAAAKTAFKLNKNGTINAYDKALTSSTNGDGTNYYNNYYSPDVVFIYADTANKTATVKTGVQAVSKITEFSKAIVEDDGDGNKVVTAVILMNDVSTTASADTLLFFPQSTAISTQVLADKDGKTANYPVYVAYKNGEQVLVPTKSTVTGQSYYSFTASDTVTGAYVLATSPYAASTGTVAVATAPIASTFSDTLIKLLGGSDLDLTGAKLTDVRTDAAQDAYPVTLTAKGICDAASSGLMVSVIYNADTGKITQLYVLTYVSKIASQTSAASATFNYAPTFASETAIVAGTDYVPAGKTVYIQASTADKTITATGTNAPTLTPVNTTAGSKFIYSFTMPVGGVAAGAFTEES